MGLAICCPIIEKFCSSKNEPFSGSLIVMMSIRKPVDISAFLILVACSAIWGFQPMVLKYVADDMPAILQLSLRHIGSAMLLLAYLAWRGMPLMPSRSLWWVGLGVGMLFALEFACVGWAIHFTNASHLTVCIYTSPIFVAMGMHFHSRTERMSAQGWIGALMAFVGIAVAFLLPEWWHPTATNTHGLSSLLIGDLLGIAGGFFWAMTTLAVRYTGFSEASPEHTLLFQLLVGAVALLALALVQEDLTSITFTPRLIGALLFQAVIVSFASYLAWFWLLRHYLANSVSTYSFMTPVFGILFGVSLLGETVSPIAVVGISLVLVGIALVSIQRQRPENVPSSTA
jgi:drug/metabolite transporter (DMT)-like permease